MRISDWSSDVCSSDLRRHEVAPRCALQRPGLVHRGAELRRQDDVLPPVAEDFPQRRFGTAAAAVDVGRVEQRDPEIERTVNDLARRLQIDAAAEIVAAEADDRDAERSEEHTSELQSLMRISYAVFCLKKKKTITQTIRRQ